MAGEQELVEDLSNLSVKDLVVLVRRLESEWGVSAKTIAQPITTVEQPGPQTPAVEEKTEFTVRLKEIGPKKIAVIKVVREVRTLDLKSAKDLVESAPADVLQDVPRDQAEAASQKLRDEGATVEIT